MVATDAEVDLEEVERWSRHEGMAEEFERIKSQLKRQRSGSAGAFLPDRPKQARGSSGGDVNNGD